MIVRVLGKEDPAEAKKVGCDKHYYTIIIFSEEGKPVEVRYVCLVTGEWGAVPPDADMYLDVTGVSFAGLTAYIFLSPGEVEF